MSELKTKALSELPVADSLKNTDYLLIESDGLMKRIKFSVIDDGSGDGDKEVLIFEGSLTTAQKTPGPPYPYTEFSPNVSEHLFNKLIVTIDGQTADFPMSTAFSASATYRNHTNGYPMADGQFSISLQDASITLPDADGLIGEFDTYSPGTFDVKIVGVKL